MAASPLGRDQYYHSIDTPPPAPPKSPTYPSNAPQFYYREQTPNSANPALGPPLPPPPPNQFPQHQLLPPYPPQLPPTPQQQQQQQQQQHPQEYQPTPPQQHQQPPQQPPSTTPHPNPQGQPPPPLPHEPWLPPHLNLPSKPTSALSPLLSSPPHLQALTQLHPSLHPTASPLPALLSQTIALAQHTQKQHAALLAQRARAQEHLLRLHGLERAWRAKQARLDGELEPWGAKRLYARLREGEVGGEREVALMGERWVSFGADGRGDGDGDEGGKGAMMGEREVAEFLRGWREGRGRVWRRREMRERWDEGRVGGWR